MIEEERAPLVALECLRSIQAPDPKHELADLRARIKAAEKEGNLEEALRLTQEMTRVAPEAQRRYEAARKATTHTGTN